MTTRIPIALLFLLALAGCVSDYDLIEGGGNARDGGDTGDGDTGDGDGDGDGDMTVTGGAPAGGGGCSGAGCVVNGVCRRGGQCSEIRIGNIDQVDLLFLVDNSNSMRDEQAALTREFPRLINVLTTGDRDGDGTQDFPPAKDLHLGVVSSDLGLPGVQGIQGCAGTGDDGVLRSMSSPDITGCSTASFNPPFLSYSRDNGDDPRQLATDFACIATLGVDGCGFEQQLESMLKAVWPGSDTQIQFVADPATGFGMTGQAGPGFPNGDFIREDSVIGLVVVTDEEDCSSSDLSHFVPGAATTGLNTRCFFEGQRPEPNNLFDVERYIAGFKALRPGAEDLVIFSAIVGVPPELVTPEQLAGVDFHDPQQSNAFFDGLLAAPAMQETLDTRDNTDPADDNIVPSCDDRGMDARAYPPRRIVQVAKGFGANGVVQSICQEDFGPAIDPIIERIASQLGGPCLSTGEERRPDGTIACDVYWSLPPPAQALAGTPTSCDQRDFLTDTSLTGIGGGEVCRVQQLPVRQDASGEVAPQPASNDETRGFYYDDFSSEVEEQCLIAPRARIMFTPGAEPPADVHVVLDCD